MFQPNVRRTTAQTIFGMLELIYHSVVREVRKTHRNALMGLVMNMMQTIVFLLTFYAMFSILGMRGAAIRGDFMLYIMSGIFLFMCHTKTVAAVYGSDGPSAPMMQHAPMTTFISLTAAALSALYLQLLSILCVLFIYHVIFVPIQIDDPIGALGMLLAAWVSGVGVGMVFFAMRPWAPNLSKTLVSVYNRASMITSGKMFVANSLPSSMLVLFDWNPLFHAIDQIRGFVFLHYNPHFSSAAYPFYIALGLIVFGLLSESYTRKSASISWEAGR